MTLLYFIFSIALGVWTYTSSSGVFDYPAKTVMYYILSLAALAVIYIAAKYLIFRHQKRTQIGITLMLLLCNMGASVELRCSQIYKYADTIATRDYLIDILLFTATFAGAYAVIRTRRFYNSANLIKAAIVACPIFLLLVRIAGKQVNGSYLSILGIQIFIILLLIPSISAYFVTKESNEFLFHGVTNMEGNLFYYLAFLVGIFGISALINNDYSLVLVVGVAAGLLFYMESKSTRSKIILTGATCALILLAYTYVTHIHNRIVAFLHLGTKVVDQASEEQMSYIFKNINYSGWFGYGLGHMPNYFLSTIDTDHVLLTLINDYGFLIFLLVVATGFLLIREMFLRVPITRHFDRTVYLTSAIMFAMILLLNIASALSSFMTCGLPFLFVGNSTTINIVMAGLLGIHYSLANVYDREV